MSIRLSTFVSVNPIWSSNSFPLKIVYAGWIEKVEMIPSALRTLRKSLTISLFPAARISKKEGSNSLPA